MKRLLLFVFCSLSCFAQSCPAPQPAANMEITFDSEFAGTGKLSTDQWHPYVGQHGPIDQEAEVYIPDNISVSKSNGLQLSIAKRSYWGHNYTAPWIDTHGLFSQAYGRFEVYAKMPLANGIWPAFWMISEDNTWPPEIDVVENVFAPFGDTKSGIIPQTTLHYLDAKGVHQFVHPAHGSSMPTIHVAPDDAYHTYAVEWRPGSIVWYFDGMATFCTSGSAVPTRPMYMILSASVAPEKQSTPHWAGKLQPRQSFPLRFNVAYVRAYQFKDLKVVPKFAIDVTGVKVSNSSPAAGQTIQVDASAIVGGKDLGKGKFQLMLYSLLDAKNYYGFGPGLVTSAVEIPALPAGKTVALASTLTMPAKLPPGLYGVDLVLNYTGVSADPKTKPVPGGFHSRQAAVLTVK